MTLWRIYLSSGLPPLGCIISFIPPLSYSHFVKLHVVVVLCPTKCVSYVMHFECCIVPHKMCFICYTFRFQITTFNECKQIMNKTYKESIRHGLMAYPITSGFSLPRAVLRHMCQKTSLIKCKICKHLYLLIYNIKKKFWLVTSYNYINKHMKTL